MTFTHTGGPVPEMFPERPPDPAIAAGEELESEIAKVGKELEEINTRLALEYTRGAAGSDRGDWLTRRDALVEQLHTLEGRRGPTVDLLALERPLRHQRTGTTTADIMKNVFSAARRGEINYTPRPPIEASGDSSKAINAAIARL